MGEDRGDLSVKRYMFDKNLIGNKYFLIPAQRQVNEPA